MNAVARLHAWAAARLGVLLAATVLVLALVAWALAERGGRLALETRVAKAAVARAEASRDLAARQAAVSSAAGAKAEARLERERVVTRTLIREVPRYVTVESDRRCDVPVGFVRLHDAAAEGRDPVSAPAGEPHDAASGLALSAVAGTVAENYGSCRETAERLTALQAWVRSQAAVAAGARPPATDSDGSGP